MDSSGSPKDEIWFCACAIIFQTQSTSKRRQETKIAMQSRVTECLNPCKIRLVGHEVILHYDVVDDYSRLQYAAASLTLEDEGIMTGLDF
jgi:hypothetical protein